MKILIVSNNYPSNNFPNAGVFVYNLIQQFAKLGHDITVIAARSRFKKYVTEVSSYGPELAQVYRPKYISTSAKSILGFNTYWIGEKDQIRSIRQTVIANKLEFDVVYAHFISNGIMAIRALESFGKPVFCAVGESDIDKRKALYHQNYFSTSIMKINGWVAVSDKLKNKLLGFGVAEDRILVKPNGVDSQIFYPREKQQMRIRHGLASNKFLISFVGRFMHHKGPLRILEAIKNIPDTAVIFVGAGPQQPQGEQVEFADKVSSASVPEFLSASDLFVLPTLKEGSCNSIVEAMACGLPVVSSDIPEVRAQCDDSFSILVDPMDSEAIGQAIIELQNDKDRLIQMGENALKASRQLDIRQRAQDILEFIASGR